MAAGESMTQRLTPGPLGMETGPTDMGHVGSFAPCHRPNWGR